MIASPAFLLLGDTHSERVRSTDLAAALLTLDYPLLEMDRAHDLTTGQDYFAFHFGEHPLKGLMPVRQLITLAGSGELENLDASHPLLIALAGINNSHALLHWARTGDQCFLRPHRGDISRYYPGPCDFRPEMGAVATTDLAAASAFGVLDVPVCNLEGAGNHCQFLLLPAPYQRDKPFVEPNYTQGLFIRFRNGELEKTTPAHALFFAYRAVKNRSVLQKRINEHPDRVLLRHKLYPKRAAFLNPDARGAAFDKARRRIQE